MQYIIGGGALLLILVILIIATRRKDLGTAGEKKVQKELDKLSLSPSYVFNDYYLIPHENASVQIDHIVVCKKGVIVIETKNISGEIYGSAGETYWKQSLARGKIIHEHHNPVLQNKTHVKCLSKALERNVKYIPLVVFVQNNIDKIKSEGVIGLNKLLHYIETLPDTMGKAAVEEITDILTEKNAAGKISKRQHIKNVRRRHKN